MRIDKRNGARLLIAVDVVMPVLSLCHPIMDVRICGDIFHLPFRSNSIDGLWNVGVMEHFTKYQIADIMKEFHRVLRTNGSIMLLWPATNSLPQKLLRLVEWGINLRSVRNRFRFHPDEISQLKSRREGTSILEQNGFRVVHVDNGLRSLMAFKTLVGVKL
jgi:predicted SAM-dependent methyltransferase